MDADMECTPPTCIVLSGRCCARVVVFAGAVFGAACRMGRSGGGWGCAAGDVRPIFWCLLVERCGAVCWVCCDEKERLLSQFIKGFAALPTVSVHTSKFYSSCNVDGGHTAANKHEGEKVKIKNPMSRCSRVAQRNYPSATWPSRCNVI